MLVGRKKENAVVFYIKYLGGIETSIITQIDGKSDSYRMKRVESRKLLKKVQKRKNG